MSVNRRNALTMLGLAATGGIVAEDMAKPVQMGSGKLSGYHFSATAEKIARTLRRLADDLESGGSHAQELTVMSKIALEDFLTHTLTVSFVMRIDETTS